MTPETTHPPDEPDTSTEPAREAAHRLAAELTAQGLPKPVIRTQLEALGLSRRTAYRVLEGVHPTPSAASPVAQPAHRFKEPDDMAETIAPDTKPASRPTLARRTIRVRVTHLHAPWPAGTKPGDVVEMPGDAIPEWAVGKCQPVPAETPAAAVWQPPRRREDDPAEFPTLAPRADEDALAERAAALQARRAELAAELEAAKGRTAQAEAHMHEVIQPDAAPPVGGYAGAVPATRAQREAEDAAHRAVKLARAAVRQIAAELAAVESQIEQAERIATAQQRLQATKEAHAAALAARDAADTRVHMIDAAILRLDNEHTAERETVTQARRAAAAVLLERAASGASLDTVRAPDEGRLNALRQARADAVEALADAKADAEKARAAVRAAAAAVWAIVADHLRPELEAAQAHLVDVATRWATAHTRGHATAPPLADIRAMVLEAAAAQG